MKIVKGPKRADIYVTGRKLIEMLDAGEIDFNIDIQRGYVWKENNRKSEFIRSLIIDYPVPPLYFNKSEKDAYDGNDGKQRALTLKKFLNDEFALSDLPLFEVINDNGDPEDVDINGLKFSQLPECFQNAIKEYNFQIQFTDGADAEQQAEIFYNLNNGKGPDAATMNRVKAKSKEQIFKIGKHEIFKEALTQVALDGHVEDTMVARAHAVLYASDPAMDTKWIRPYMKEVEITTDQVMEITNVLDRIHKVHSLIEDDKTAKRIYGKTHIISIVPMIYRSIIEGKSDEDVMRWIVQFFCGSKKASISKVYNDAAGGSGTGKKEAVKKRLDELQRNYEEYFKESKAELSKAS